MIYRCLCCNATFNDQSWMSERRRALATFRKREKVYEVLGVEA